MATNPTNPYEGMSNEELRARMAKSRAEAGQQTEQQKRNEAVLKQSDAAVSQAAQRAAALSAQLSQYRQRSQQDTQRLAAQRAETEKFKQGLKAKTASDVQAIGSGAVEPGSAEWDSIVQGAIQSVAGIKPARAKVQAEKLAAERAETEKQYGYKNPFLEEDVKSAVKESIVQQFMENAKFARRGAEKQRPKSWNKGVKSGSEKKKMREEGKREARDLNEDRSWVYAAHHAFSGLISPANITKHFENKQFSSVDQFRSAVKQLADDHADRFISTQDREGANPEKAMAALSDEIVDKFDNKVAEFARAQKSTPSAKSASQYKRDGTDAARDQRVSDEFGGRWRDYYDQPRHWRESVEHTLRSRLMEAGSWGPEMAGASQDDATAAAYEEESREKDANTPKKMSHADVIEKLNLAHEAALSRIATSYGKGGKHHGKDPYYMLGHYMEHLEDLHNPIRSDLT